MKVLEFEQSDSIDIGLELRESYGSDKKLTLTLTDDWCGDTETGFGASVSIEIDREKAKKMLNYLSEWLVA